MNFERNPLLNDQAQQQMGEFVNKVVNEIDLMNSQATVTMDKIRGNIGRLDSNQPILYDIENEEDCDVTDEFSSEHIGIPVPG